ncbi:tyrosine-type recombinase/integrase [Eubacterium sp.]|uniref:tyrosine-type recombinase/integrase n=1 Tax=Eubacterium sp. TaxID=142586 RepID=UPI002FC95B2B
MAKKKVRKERKVTVGVDPITGTSIRKSFYGYTPAEIDRKVQEYYSNIGKAEILREDFCDYAEKWMETYKRDVVSDITYRQTYLRCLKVFQEYFHGRRIADITQGDIQMFFVKKKDRDQWDGKKYKYILDNIFKSAVREGLATSSPVYDITIFSKESKQKRAYSLEDYKNLLDYAKQHPDGLGSFLALKTGMRRGELCGLMWADIDADNLIIYVNRSVTFVDHRATINPKGKTKNAVRPIPVDQETIDHLSTIEKVDDYILGCGHNIPVDPHNYASRAYTRFMDDATVKLGIDRLTMHELRHTYGTILYKAGTGLDAIAKVMGHASIETTRRIYVHEDIEDIRSRIQLPTLKQ